MPSPSPSPAKGGTSGFAPLGTSLTDEQAHQLARIGAQPIVATDADLAGRIAAERDSWMLSWYRLDPLYARLPDGTDPADLLAIAGPTALTDALARAQPLAEQLIDERLKNLPPTHAVLEAARVVAARPSRHWNQDSTAISSRLGAASLPSEAVGGQGRHCAACWSHRGSPGLREHNGEIVGEAAWPAIIDHATHDRLVGLLDDPSRRREKFRQAPCPPARRSGSTARRAAER